MLLPPLVVLFSGWGFAVRVVSESAPDYSFQNSSLSHSCVRRLAKQGKASESVKGDPID